MPANGARFHVAEYGDPAGRLVLLVHGLPQFWWLWRQELVALGDAGWRVAALDLRGCGASDKPPTGYDVTTGARDVTAVIRALGASSGVVVGQGWGGLLAWSLPALAPRTVTAVAALAAPHPLELRGATAWRHGWRSTHLAGAWRRPVRPDRPDGPYRYLEGVLGDDAPGPYPAPDELEGYARALQVTRAAHAVGEYRRWLLEWSTGLRSLELARLLRAPVDVPVLQVHGGRDRVVSPAWARASARRVTGRYRWHEISRAGHFPAMQAPDAVGRVLRDWLTRL